MSKKPTKAQIAEALKSAQSLAAKGETIGEVVGLDLDDWTPRVIPSDLPAERAESVRRKLINRGFKPAADWGVDGLSVSGHNGAEVWLIPTEVHQSIHLAERERRIRESGFAPNVPHRIK